MTTQEDFNAEQILAIAAVIRKVDGNHDAGAGELATRMYTQGVRILTDPTPMPQTVLMRLHALSGRWQERAALTDPRPDGDKFSAKRAKVASIQQCLSELLEVIGESE
jgi:hypothetical protein